MLMSGELGDRETPTCAAAVLPVCSPPDARAPQFGVPFRRFLPTGALKLAPRPPGWVAGALRHRLWPLDDEAVRLVPLRPRFWLTSGLAGGCALLALLTSLWRDWIEALTGFDPDRGSGSLEWMLVTGLAVAAVLLGTGAGREWHRSRAMAQATAG
jgi:hypothetical protein